MSQRCSMRRDVEYRNNNHRDTKHKTALSLKIFNNPAYHGWKRPVERTPRELLVVV